MVLYLPSSWSWFPFSYMFSLSPSHFLPTFDCMIMCMATTILNLPAYGHLSFINTFSIRHFLFISFIVKCWFLQGSSVGLVNTIQPTCSNAPSPDSMISTKTEPILCFTARQGHSSLSFSGLTGESNAGDYQDCGASLMLLMGEPSWCPPCPESPLPSANRSDAVKRYMEKKKTRK